MPSFNENISFPQSGGSGASTEWRAPVDTFVDLSTVAVPSVTPVPIPGETRTVLDTDLIYTYDEITDSWIVSGSASAPVQSVNGEVGVVVLDASDVGAVPTARTITAGAGLTGGGDLSVNRVISLINLGTTNDKLAAMAQNTIKGQILVGTQAPQDLTATEVRTVLGVPSAILSGVSGTFTTTDLKTITVTNGIITSIV